MAALPDIDRQYTWEQAMRDGYAPAHWSKVSFRAAINSVDAGMDTLLSDIATALSVGVGAVSTNMQTFEGIFALMAVAQFRTAVATMKAAAETAAGATFLAPGESGTFGNIMSNRRFALVFLVVLKRRDGKYISEKE